MAIIDRTATWGLRGLKLRIAITATATIGFSLFGYNQGMMSGIISGDQFTYEFPAVAGTSSHATVVQGAVTSCYELGCFFGALFALFRGDRIGRKPLVLAGAVIITIGTIISVTPFRHSWAIGQFVIGRVTTGVGNGINTATIPVWQSEMSKPQHRGRLVNLEGSIVAVGTLIAYWVDFGLSYTSTSIQWRLPVALQIVFAVALFAGMIGLPDSPRWFISKGRKEEALYIAAALNNSTTDDEEVQDEIRVAQEAVMREQSQVGIKDVITGGPTQHFQRMILGASTQFFQQITGCNAAIYYSTVLFKNSMHLGDRMSLILGGVFSTVYAVATIPSFFLVDKIGRRKLFMIGAIGQGCSFLITMGCLVKETEQNSKGAAVGLFLFITFFAFSLLPLPWVYPPEINPLRTRTVATGFSTCTNWIFNFAVVMFTPVFVSNTRWGAYLFFAIMNFLFVPVIYFGYPETAGRSLEEVDIIFARSFNEKRAPFKVAMDMPRLSPGEIETEASRLGLYEIEPQDFEKPPSTSQESTV